MRDLLYALRALRRNPGFTATAIVTLALGIGANAAIFSLVRAVLVPGLPFLHPDRLVALEMHDLRSGQTAPGMNWSDAADFRQETRVFEGLGMQGFALLNLVGNGRPEALYGARVSAGMLRLLGVGPRIGRTFEDADDLPGSQPVILLSDWLWRDHFAADPSIVGSTISLVGPGARQWLVIGVMPPGFSFPLTIPTAVNPETRRMAYWIPMALDAARLGRGNYGGSAVARLRPGVTLAEAQADADRVAANLARAYPSTNRDRGVRLVPLAESVFGRARVTMLVVLAATGLVLLIACANIAGLLLVRATARSRETAMRLALGASRARLVRQWTTEALAIAFAGGAAGLLLAALCREFVRKLAPPDLPGIDQVRIDGLVLAFTAAVSTLAGLLFGIVPAWRAAHADPHAALSGGYGALGPRRGSAGPLVVAGEAALAVLLTIGAGLLTRSLANLLAVDLGYQPSHVLMAIITTFDQQSHPEATWRLTFYRRLLEELQRAPGVEAAGAVIGVPLSGNFPASRLQIEGTASAPGVRPLAEIVPASEDYFRAIGIPLLRGRVWTRREAEAGLPVAVVNAVAAARFWPGQDPIGKRLSIDVQPGHPWVEVTGIVQATREDSPDKPPSPAIYLPMEQGAPYFPQFLAVRTRADAAAFAPILRRLVARVDKDQPVYVVNSMQSLIDSATSERRFAAWTLALFAALALLLAAAGIYGVASYSVARRTREIGVRMAMGATCADVARLIVRQGVLPAAAGIPVGLGAALALTRVLANLLYGVTARDPVIFVSVPAVLLAVELVACYVPARRAMRIEPAAALRTE